MAGPFSWLGRNEEAVISLGGPGRQFRSMSQGKRLKVNGKDIERCGRSRIKGTFSLFHGQFDLESPLNLISV